MRPSLGLAALLAVVLGCPGRGHADDQIIGVLHIEVEGVSRAAGEAFEASLEEGIAGAGFKIASRKRLGEILAPTDYVVGCLFGPCLAKVFQVTEVRLVLIARISGAGRSYSVVATLVDTRTGVPTSQVAESCTPCSVDEAMGTATLAVIALVTGTGDATVIDPSVGPTGAPGFRGDDEPAAIVLRARLARQKRALRRTGYFLLGVAGIAGGVAAFALASDETDDSEVAYPAAGAGAALVLGASTLFVLSARY